MNTHLNLSSNSYSWSHIVLHVKATVNMHMHAPLFDYHLFCCVGQEYKQTKKDYLDLTENGKIC